MRFFTKTLIIVVSFLLLSLAGITKPQPANAQAGTQCCDVGQTSGDTCFLPDFSVGYCSSLRGPNDPVCESSFSCRPNPNPGTNCCAPGKTAGGSCLTSNGTPGTCSSLGGNNCQSQLTCNALPDCCPANQLGQSCQTSTGESGTCLESSNPLAACRQMCVTDNAPAGTFRCRCQQGAGGIDCSVEINSCGAGSAPDTAICRFYPTGQNPPCSSIPGSCNLSCSSNRPGLGEHGDSCTNNSECAAGLECADYNTDHGTCAYAGGSRFLGESCLFSQECAPDPDPNFSADCMAEGGRTCAMAGLPDTCTCSTEQNDTPREEEDGEVEKFRLCTQLPGDENDGASPRGKCSGCLGSDSIWTSLGCFPKGRTPLITTLVRVGLSLAGGIALLSILTAAFMFSTSSGNQQKVSDARDLMTSAIIGLLFIIFSVTILQFIGGTVLRIPGFG